MQVTIIAEEVSLRDRQEADRWLNKWDWKAAGKILRFITIGHAGHQLRIWTGWCRYLCPHMGGHFDTSEEKLFDVDSEDTDVIEYVLSAIKRYSGRQDWMTFNADTNCPDCPGSYVTPLKIIVPA